jgi:integrase
MRSGQHLSVRAGQNIWHRYVDPVQAGTRSHMGHHTAITNCLRSTQDLWKAVSLAGHSSPRLVISTYGHVLSRDSIATAEAMAAGHKAELASRRPA